MLQNPAALLAEARPHRGGGGGCARAFAARGPVLCVSAVRVVRQPGRELFHKFAIASVAKMYNRSHR
jgi:hypothetical protein